MRSGNGRKHYSSLCKIKNNNFKINNEMQWMRYKSLHFNFTTMFIQPSFQLSSYLANITKITKRAWNKIDAIPVLNRNRIFKIKFSSSKDPILIENQNGIYFIPCFPCNLGYIGQTRRQLKARFDEHRLKVKNEELKMNLIYCISLLVLQSLL